MTTCSETIRTFWDDRARKFGATSRATLNEETLRKLELRTMAKRIAFYKPDRVLDMGCGNGYSTKYFARRFPKMEFIGVDYSEAMISHAVDGSPENCRFQVGDVLDVKVLPAGPFDLILTQRCLQNLPEDGLQQSAIENLMSLRSRGGHLLLMECSKDGVRQLNRLRRFLRRPCFGNIEPWHNRFLFDNRMRRRYGARIEHFSSTYMFLVKAIHPKMARIAWRLPSLGRFGYDKLYVID